MIFLYRSAALFFSAVLIAAVIQTIKIARDR